MAKRFEAPERQEPFYPSMWDDEFNSGDDQAKVAWPRILTLEQQQETASAAYAVWKAQGMLPKYENMEDYRAFFLADWQRGYQYRVAQLQKKTADNQRFNAMPAYAATGRTWAWDSIEDEPLEVGSIHNRPLHPKGSWMLEVVKCEKYDVLPDEEMDFFDETHGWLIWWAEPQKDGRGGARLGAGRKRERTPEYDEGYNAGFQAGYRKGRGSF